MDTKGLPEEASHTIPDLVEIQSVFVALHSAFTKKLFISLTRMDIARISSHLRPNISPRGTPQTRRPLKDLFLNYLLKSARVVIGNMLLETYGTRGAVNSIKLRCVTAVIHKFN